MNWYIDAFKNYANFQGRARRKAYWMFVLFWFVAAIIAITIDNLLGTNGIVSGLYWLGTIVPFIATAVRR
ncbi:MAG: DUF805 domain-containing protein, partial [Chthoniobacterales bacterium]